MQVIVLGAGLAGLAAAVRAAREGAAVVLLESEAHVGGMVRSEQVGPWHLDHGPHRFWSRDPHVLALAREMMGADVVESERRATGGGGGGHRCAACDGVGGGRGVGGRGGGGTGAGVG